MSITVKTGSVDDFFARGKKVAKALDKGEPIEPGITISFENPVDMMRFLSETRIKLLHKVRENPGPVKVIAKALHREPSAVAKDIKILREAGLVIVRKVKNDGHGRMNFVEAASEKLKLEATL